MAAFRGEIMKYHRCKKISRGHYLYRGVEIICIGYYPPEQRVVWEGSIISTKAEKIECGDYHGFTKKEIMMWIDEDLKDKTSAYQRRKIDSWENS